MKRAWSSRCDYGPAHFMQRGLLKLQGVVTAFTCGLDACRLVNVLRPGGLPYSAGCACEATQVLAQSFYMQW